MRTGSLTIESSGGTQHVALQGIGLNSGLSVSVSPSALSFPTQVLKTTSSYQNVTITNTGTQALTLTGTTITGANPHDFVFFNGCGATLASAASCTVQVAFRPTQRGARSASISVIDNASDSPQVIALVGTGTANSLSASSMIFGDVSVGTSSSQTLTLTNVGTFATALSPASITGVNPKPFSQSSNCGSSLAPNASCVFTVTFSPNSRGTRNAYLSFRSNGTGNYAQTNIPLTGTGK